MKIAILTSGVLPVPAVSGGAVENLIDFCLEYNNEHKLHNITVYSVSHPDIKKQASLKSDKANHYIYIHTNRWIDKVCRYCFRKTHKNFYYHYTVEYFLTKALKKIEKGAFDIILIENRPGYVLKIKDWTEAKLVLHQENDYLNSNTPYHQTIYDSTTLIINTSDYITHQVRTINPKDTKCVTVLNGIDTSKFYSSQPMNREALGLNEADFIIVFSGRLTQEKGVLQLIKAIKRLSINYKLLIIGASAYGKNRQITPFVRQLQEEAKPIKERVVFTGFIDYNLVPSYLKTADIAVVPSMWEEPFGLTVVEAMAAGLPLVTTRSGGIPEICEGVATIVERENIVENLAKAIMDLYEHPDKRTAMAKASLERSKMFDKETYAKNFFAAITNI